MAGVALSTASNQFVANAGAAYVDISSDSTSKWTPAIWSGKMVENFYSATVCSEICNTDWEGDIAGQGDTVIIRTTPEIAITRYAKGDRINYQLPESANVTLSIDQALSFAYGIDNIDKYQSDIDLLNDWTEDAGRRLKIEVDRDVLAYAHANAGVSGQNNGDISGNIDVGSTGAPIAVARANVINYIIRLGVALDEADVPDDYRFLVVPSAMLGVIKDSELRDASLAGDATSQLRNGLVGMIDRFTVFHSNLLPTGVAGGLAAGEYGLLAGHRSGMTFAGQIMDNTVKHMDNPESHGELVRGLMVYGREVIKPESVAAGVVTVTL